jgi:DNA-binding transcriptional MerR regulator
MATPLLKLGGVSRATGVPLATLGRWCDRGTIKQSRRDKASTGHGDHRQFSRNTIVQIAIARKLIELGISAGRANKAAAAFTDEGQTGRAPGALFSCGRTVLIISTAGARVRQTFHDTTLAEAGTCSIILDLNWVVGSVDELLQKAT